MLSFVTFSSFSSSLAVSILTSSFCPLLSPFSSSTVVASARVSLLLFVSLLVVLFTGGDIFTFFQYSISFRFLMDFSWVSDFISKPWSFPELIILSTSWCLLNRLPVRLFFKSSANSFSLSFRPGTSSSIDISVNNAASSSSSSALSSLEPAQMPPPFALPMVVTN